MKRKTEFVVFSERSKEEACAAIRALSEKERWVVRVTKWTRTNAQNSLYWKWVWEIAEDTGNSPERIHSTLKEDYLVPIRYRDDERFREMIDRIANMGDGRNEDLEFIKAWIVAEISTTKLNITQMKEFLGRIKLRAGEEGWKITIPPNEELKRLILW